MVVVEGMCEMCGYVVDNRKKAVIVSEGRDNDENILMLCPSCHAMFESYLRPKISNAIFKTGVQLPVSWRQAITDKAAEMAAEALRRKGKT